MDRANVREQKGLRLVADTPDLNVAPFSSVRLSFLVPRMEVTILKNIKKLKYMQFLQLQGYIYIYIYI